MANSSSVSSPLNTTSSQTSVPRLAAYQKVDNSVILTKPGYDVYFYSRADASLNPYPDLESETNFVSFSQVTPTFQISSYSSDSGDISIINMIQVASRVNNTNGHQAVIEMVEPQGVEYFKPTIGDKTKAPPDYDHSWLQTSTNASNSKTASVNTTQHRIGTMDTVIIKLNNNTLINSTQVNSVKETVFRGVISNIVRSKSPKGGSIIRLECLDFSEFMRQMFAIPEGFLSTVSFSITGRGLANNLLRYANITLSGSNQIPGISQAVQKIVNHFISGTQADGTVAGQTNSGASQSTNHAMICPPFFWQEFAAYKGTGTPDDIFGGQNGLQNEIQTLVQKYTASVTGASQTPEMQDSKLDEVNTTIENDISQAFKTLAQAGTGALAVSLTPEDKWAIDSYQNFISDGIVPSQVSKLNAYSGTTSSKVNLSLQKNAWILSDVYLEKGLITFEEQQVWATIYEAASRSNREVYFDIAPKLTKGNRLVGGPCKSMFDTAEVPEIGVNNLGNTKYNPNNLDDIHPNIGILKYRLSPCFLPYPSGGVDPAAEFRYFDITDDMIMETETSENEQMVFSAVYGFADSFNNQTIPDYATSVLSAASPFPFVYAHSIDPNIEKRLGYRFMTEHDNKIKILPLMYLVSYILLEKSQLSMFSQTVKITGNPIIQPGSIVKMESQQVDYYCTEVQHNWGFDGYTTSLVLQYGHQTGVAPAAMTGVGVDEQFTQLSTMLCQSGANQVAQFVPSSTNIGGVNEQCLISAMWEYMTCRASTSDALKKCTRAYETANPYKGPAEWASLSYNDSVNETWSTNPSFPYPANIAPQPSTNRDSQIDAALTQTGAAAYNFTRNILKNIINYESSWVGNNYNPKGPAYGWFQLTPGSGADNSTDQQTVSSYNGFGVAATKACNLLIQKCTALGISQNNASGPNVMAAVNAYGDGTSTYASNVMGDSQYNQIMSNPPTIGPANSTPGNIRTGLSCQDGTAAANLTKWPYDVYGPIGMHPSSVAQVSSGTSISQAKQLLLGASPNTFADAMTVSVKYMDYLLRKYSNATFMQNQPGYSFLTQSDTFSKVIAAWFSDETVASSSALAILPNVITQINSLYQQCIGCTGVNQASISANSSSENMAVFQGINWQCPLGSGAVITGQFHEPRVGHLHQGIDIVQPNSSNVGTAVVAPADGIVSPYTEGGAGGLAMSINHTLNGQICGAQSVFYDIGKYAPGISAGSTVKAGQIVAYLPTTEKQGSYGGIGANGQALIRAESGFHLHWEVRPGVANASTEIGGQAVDPNQFLNPTLNLA